MTEVGAFLKIKDYLNSQSCIAWTDQTVGALHVDGILYWQDLATIESIMYEEMYGNDN